MSDDKKILLSAVETPEELKYEEVGREVPDAINLLTRALEQLIEQHERLVDVVSDHIEGHSKKKK